METSANRRNLVRLAVLLVPLLGLCTLSGCGALRGAGSASLPDLDSYGTFAFTRGLPNRPAPEGATEVVLEPELAQEFQAAIEARLIARGLVPVDRSDAQLLIANDFAVAERTAYYDPQMAAFYIGDRFEDGVLRIELLDGETLDRLHSDEARRPLRRLARGYGALNTTWQPVDEARDWPVEALVRDLLD